MTSMVERMARAIFDAAHEFDADAPSWDAAEKGLQRYFRATALAALREMREPTDVMLSGLGYVSIRDARMAYADKIRPMIDAEIAAYEAGR